jgi:hypothetical protein
MATPITHIVLTAKIFNNYFSDKKEKDFYIGTLLPDIRYLKVIKRNKIHFENLNINAIRQEDSFMAGLKFHSLLDEVREKFIIQNKLYDYCPDLNYKIEALKLLEDILLYDKINNWQKFIDFLKQILPQELKCQFTRSSLKMWHLFLQNYFSQKPTPKIRAILAKKLGLNKPAINELNLTVQKISKQKKIVASVFNLYDNFDRILKIICEISNYNS